MTSGPRISLTVLIIMVTSLMTMVSMAVFAVIRFNTQDHKYPGRLDRTGMADVAVRSNDLSGTLLCIAPLCGAPNQCSPLPEPLCRWTRQSFRG